jgi:UDPglucose--hexose-1-phosphate uridylyltransferase
MGNQLDSVFRESPHRRFNPLSNEWVLVSPHRTQRPWQGAVESVPLAQRPKYDPSCYLCPGNQRANGELNPQYHSTFVFENDFAALKKNVAPARLDVGDRGLLVAETEAGICRVMCFSPRHDLTLATMGAREIEPVVREWTAQTLELAHTNGIRHVQIFENRGEMMGASNPHPHCQIWATSTVPQAPDRELFAQRNYREKNNSCLLCDYTALEEQQQLRVVGSNAGFVAVVPFWAVWPFEVLVCSRRHFASFLELSESDVSQLSELLKQLTSSYDRLFDVAFPYSMGFHQQPFDGDSHPEWHFHAHFYPPLLRSATVRKFMVGFEMLGTPQRDITPELAADRVRSLTSK